MFQALCAHHHKVKLYYTASGIVTPVGGRPVHRLRQESYTILSWCSCIDVFALLVLHHKC